MGEAYSYWWLNSGDISVRQVSKPLAMVRIKDFDANCHAALTAAFEIAWPDRPNTIAIRGALTVHWMSPEEWLVMGASAATVVELVRRGCMNHLYHVADVTDGRVIFEISGTYARDVLAKGCSLDLHPRSFHPGRCAQSLLAQIPVLVAAPAESTIPFIVTVDVSFTTYLRTWFEDAAREYISQS